MLYPSLNQSLQDDPGRGITHHKQELALSCVLLLGVSDSTRKTVSFLDTFGGNCIDGRPLTTPPIRKLTASGLRGRPGRSAAR